MAHSDKAKSKTQCSLQKDVKKYTQTYNLKSEDKERTYSLQPISIAFPASLPLSEHQMKLTVFKETL